MTKVSYEHKLDDALNFLATHGAKGGSFDYYDKRRSEANGFKEYLFKHLSDNYKIDENEMFPILYNLIGDGYVDAVWEPVTAKEAGQQPNQVKISYKGIAFNRKGGYKKQKFKDGLKKTFQIVNIGIVTLAALAAILHYSLELKDRCDKKPNAYIEQNTEVKASTSNTNQVDTDKTQQADTIIELKVKLIDTLSKLKKTLVYCGTFKVQISLRYKVLEVKKGPYSKNEISIKYDCPLEAIENNWLENGKTYTYKLKRHYKVLNFAIGQKEKPVATTDYEIL